jgi:hypothetical protein
MREVRDHIKSNVNSEYNADRGNLIVALRTKNGVFPKAGFFCNFLINLKHTIVVYKIYTLHHDQFVRYPPCHVNVTPRILLWNETDGEGYAAARCIMNKNETTRTIKALHCSLVN